MSNILNIEVSIGVHLDNTPAVLIIASDSYDQSYRRYEPEDFFREYSGMSQDEFIGAVIDWPEFGHDADTFSSIELVGFKEVCHLIETQEAVQFITVTERIGELYEVKRDIAVTGVGAEGLTIIQLHELLKDNLQATNNLYEDDSFVWWTSHDGVVSADIDGGIILSSLHPDFQTLNRMTPNNVWSLA